MLSSNTTYVIKVSHSEGAKDYKLKFIGGNSTEENS